jgi:hypothetical protein
MSVLHALLALQVYSFALQTARCPAVIVMGGGYTRPDDRTVEAHSDVYRTAAFRLRAAAASGGPVEAAA